MERSGIAVMRESGAAKCRLPRGSSEAILINTSGGLAGGDQSEINAEVGTGATLTLTSQAAERVYRTLGPAARVRVLLTVGARASLLWVPQECILFQGSALDRTLDVDLAAGATVFVVEPMVFGRHAMGEQVDRVAVTDRWSIRQGGRLVHAEAFRVGPDFPHSAATFANNHATACVVLISPQAEALLDRVRAVLGSQDGASAWNGKLVARVLAPDGYHLRKTLVQVISACVGRDRLPRCWTF